MNYWRRFLGFSLSSRQMVRPTKKKQRPATQATRTPTTFSSPEGWPNAEKAKEPIKARLTAASIAANETTAILTANPRHPERTPNPPEAAAEPALL